MKKKLYEELASRVDAVFNCMDRTNTTWEERHRDFINYLTETRLPQGSGFDNGTEVWIDEAGRSENLYLFTSYHVMNENGMYEDWIDIEITIKPSLVHGFTTHLKGRFGKHQDLKDYIHEVFDGVLNEEIDVEDEYSKSIKYWNKQESMAN